MIVSPRSARPSSAGLVVRRLLPSEEPEARAFLRARPADDAYLLGQLARGVLDEPATPLVGAFVGRRLSGLALIGPNVVLSHGLEPAAVEALLRFGDDDAGGAGDDDLRGDGHGDGRTLARGVRVAVGPDLEMRSLRALVEAATPERVRLVRDGQALLEVDRTTLSREARSVELRPALESELDALMAIDLRMVVEELGIDPFSGDLASYRRAWQRRIVEQRAWVAGPIGGPLHAKVDQAAVSADVVQLAGVYTAPEHRRRGLARRVVGEMCHLLLREAPRVVLYVNRDNEAALRLYRGLGFYRVGSVCSFWLA